MIHEISASDPRFKRLTFKPGMNLLLSDRGEHSTNKDTRNGTGKSSLIRLVHFLCGGTVSAKSIWRHPAISDWRFRMQVDVGESPLWIERSPSNPKIHVWRGELNELTRESLSVSELTEQLGEEWFGLTASDPVPRLTMRTLFHHFARLVSDDGFSSPQRASSKFKAFAEQAAVMYLLGLDWHMASERQRLRATKSDIDVLKRSATSGELSGTMGDPAQIRAELVDAEERLEGLRRSLSGFTVVDSYRERQAEADEITREVAALQEAIELDERLVRDLHDALSDASTVSRGLDVDSVWSQINAELGEFVVRRYEEARVFREAVARNRTQYLQDEIEAADARLRQRRDRQATQLRERDRLMRLLRAGGALDQFEALTGDVARQESLVDGLRQRYEISRSLASGRVEVKRREAEMLSSLDRYLAERDDYIRELTRRFSDLMNEVYDGGRPAALEVKAAERGIAVETVTRADLSTGIGQMKVFCFDMLVMALAAERNVGPGFLLHDSHLFDGVDNRQKSRALQLGRRFAETYGFQYIVTLNSDEIPRLPGGFMDDVVMEVRLRDDASDGGLFGMRFA